MADTTEGDTNLLYLGLLVPALIAFIPGLMIHSFIIGVNVNDWWKGRSMTPVDLIGTCLGISRICTQFFITVYMFAFRFIQSSQDLHVTLIITEAIYVFFIYFSSWLTTLFSIVFCLKICNLHTRLFLYLRRMILDKVVYCTVASALLSSLNSLKILLSAIAEVTNGGNDNTTSGCTNVNHIYSYTIGNIIPMLFFYISSVLLFTSLYHHTRKMKMSSNLTINLETYYSAMKLVSFTFFYNTVYFIGQFVCIFYYYFYCVILGWLNVVINFLPDLHSSYLIYRTAKLRNQMSKILQNVIDFLTS